MERGLHQLDNLQAPSACLSVASCEAGHDVRNKGIIGAPRGQGPGSEEEV